VVDFGQNFSGWVRLTAPGPAGRRITLSHGEWLDRDGDLTTAHLDVDLPVVPEPLPLGQVDEVIPGSSGTVFEPRFTTHGFRYVRVEGHPGPLGTDDVTGVVVHSDLRRLGWFSCSDDRVNRLHEAVVWSLRSNIAHERYLWDTGFHWGEWPEPGVVVTDFAAFTRADKSEVATAYLYRSAATMVRVAEVLGLSEDQWRPYQAIAEGALEAWRREFIRDDGTLAAATQASHVRALAFGLVPAELRAAVAGQLAELISQAGGHLATGFLSTGDLLPVLAEAGYLGLAYGGHVPAPLRRRAAPG
jgi:hypothetical protein